MVLPVRRAERLHGRTSEPAMMRKVPERDKLGSVSMVRIISGNLGELIGPGVNDWMTIDVIDAGHDAFLEFVF